MSSKRKPPIVKSIDSITITGMTDNDSPYKMTFTEFNWNKVKLENVCGNGKKTLTLSINGGYTMKVEQ